MIRIVCFPSMLDNKSTPLSFHDESLQKKFITELLSFPNKAKGIAINAPIKQPTAKEFANAKITKRKIITKLNGFSKAFFMLCLFKTGIWFSEEFFFFKAKHFTDYV